MGISQSLCSTLQTMFPSRSIGRASCQTPDLKSSERRNDEKGAGHYKAIFFTLILAAVIYVGFKVVPILINEYQFQDGIQNIARFASVNRTGSDAIKRSVMDEAEKENLPVQEDNIKVQGVGRTINISVDYSVTVDLMAYQWTLNFHPSASNQAMF
jgi:cell division protein FtsL